MKYAQILVLPQIPPGGLTASTGPAPTMPSASSMRPGRSAPGSASRTTAGIGKLITGLRTAGVSETAIERSDGVLVGALLDAGLTVVVITSRQMKNLRSRYGCRRQRRPVRRVRPGGRAAHRSFPAAPAGPGHACDHHLARGRPRPPYLVAHRIAACNQLRAHLAAAFPAGAGLFARLDSQISLAFLARFGSQDAAGQLSVEDLAAWLHTLPYRGNAARPEQLHARLHAAPRGPPEPTERPGQPSPAPWWPP